MKQTVNQKIASSHTGSHALVLAGPGTGKTTTLIERCRLLIEKGVPLDALFVTTFTQQSAREIKARLRASLVGKSGNKNYEDVLDGAFIGTFHSLCVRLLKRFPTDIGLPYDFEIIGDDQVKKILLDLGYDWDEEVGSIPDMIMAWKEGRTSVEKAAEEAEKLGDLLIVKAARAYKEYQGYVEENHCVDFVDMIGFATKLLRANGQGARWFRDRFQHFIVDEFQDSNRSQIEFLVAAVGKHGEMWAVGDEDQSLYEWRGSDPRYCLHYPKIFPGAKLFKLTESFRCTPVILQMANQTIKNNKQRFSKSLKPARAERQGEFVMYKSFVKAEHEASWIADHIAKYLAAGSNPNEVAVLFRTAGISSLVQKELGKRNIPFKTHGMTTFWQLPEIQYFLTAVAQITDDNRFPVSGFGKTKCGYKCRSLSEELKGAEVSMFADPLARVLIEYRPTALDTERKSSWMANVESILSMLLSSASAEEFLDMATKKIKDAEHTTKGVTLSSLHSAKGLEWETVFIAGAEDDQLPHHRSKNLEEERRLYFVGMTRAKHHLIVTYARSRFDKDKIPSRFLRESLVKVRQRTGVFKWLDDEITKPKVKAGMSGGAMPSSEASGNPKKSRREGRSYRYKGGKSLIPPEERGK